MKCINDAWKNHSADIHKLLISFLCISFLFFALESCSKSSADAVILKNNSKTVQKSAQSLKNIPPQYRNVSLKYNSREEMQQKDRLVLGMHTGFVMVDKLTRELFPNAKIEYYNTNADMAYLVSTGKLDGFINDEPVIRYAAIEVSNLGYIHCGLETMNIVAGFPKTQRGDSLCREFNQYIKKWKADGTLKKTDDLWLSGNEDKKVIDLDSLQNPAGKKGTIRFATAATNPPFDYIKDGKIVGYEVDLIARFCREEGYALEVENVPFDSLVMGIESGMYDMIAACLSETPAHRESMNLSEALYISELVMAVEILNGTKSDETKEASAVSDYKKSPLSSLLSSFEKTFILEARWKLVVKGIGITVLISLMSAIFGTVLGFGICGLRLSKNKIADAFALSFIRLMQGLPMVVLLMILFYIVFARTNLNGIWVAAIGFGMNFGAYVSEMIRTGILAVDRGQMEAALSLGYPKAKAFVKIILPQAARHFLPVYQGEFISLVKMTSIVGYIAIQDLTKASDIIRSRTYEAFFPLVTTAIIYFVITWLLTRLLSAMQSRLDPKRRRNKLLQKMQKASGGEK